MGVVDRTMNRVSQATTYLPTSLSKFLTVFGPYDTLESPLRGLE